MKIYNLIRLLVTNLLIAIVILAVVDLVITSSYFVRNAKKYSQPDDKMNCNSVLTSYDYCSSLVHVNFLDSRDGVFPIYNFIGEDRRSVYQTQLKKPSTTRKEKIYLLGDSFIQAEEMPIEERFEHLLRVDGYDVFASGYSSWNSWQYSRIATQLPISNGDHVFIFTMTNDYTPTYGSSTIKTLSKAHPTEDEQGAQPLKHLLDDYIGQSFLYNRVFLHFLDVLHSIALKRADVNRPVFELPPATTRCNTEKERKMTSSALAHDYIALSKDSSCWSTEITESVDANIKLLKMTKKSIESRGGVLDIIMVPAGWAFKNQNTVGRMTGDYQFSYGVATGQDGLVRYMNASGLLIHDLTLFLEQHSKKDDDMYFPVDGHWTPYAHATIHSYLKKNFLTSPESTR